MCDCSDDAVVAAAQSFLAPHVVGGLSACGVGAPFSRLSRKQDGCPPSSFPAPAGVSSCQHSAACEDCCGLCVDCEPGLAQESISANHLPRLHTAKNISIS